MCAEIAFSFVALISVKLTLKTFDILNISVKSVTVALCFLQFGQVNRGELSAGFEFEKPFPSKTISVSEEGLLSRVAGPGRTPRWFKEHCSLA